MKPVFSECGPFTVMGVVQRVRRGTETPELFAGLWSRFESHQSELSPFVCGDRFYGVSLPTAEDDATDYLAGVEVPADTPSLDGLEKRSIPAGYFAVFESPVESIGDCYRQVFDIWLPAAEAVFDPTVPVFEEYPPGRPVRIHIPLETSGDPASLES